MKQRLFDHFWTTLGGILGGAAIGAGVAVKQQITTNPQAPLVQAAISGAILGAITGLAGAIGGAAKDPGKVEG